MMLVNHTHTHTLPATRTFGTINENKHVQHI